MILKRALVLASLILMTVSCSKKVRSGSGGYASPIAPASADAQAITSLPTRPNGGDVIGKGSSADPEEAEARRNQNLVQPVVFGQSVAGITMNTRYSEAQGILNYYGSADGRDFYSEHIAVLWSNDDDPLPLVVFILDGYGNTLDLPAPYGKVSTGKSMAQFVSTAADANKFLLDIGAFIEKQPSTYNCETTLTCQLVENATSYVFQYKRGGIRISKQAPYAIEFIYFIVPQTYYARATDPILYGLSIAGATFQTKRTTFEARFGPGATGTGGFQLYDRNSVAIIWGSNNTPLTMAANNTYQGALNFGAVIGNRKINDSFASFTPPAADPNGTELAKIIVRGLLNKPAAFDCTTATVTTEQCTIQVQDGLIFVQQDRSNFLFTDDANRTFLQYMSNAP